MDIAFWAFALAIWTSMVPPSANRTIAANFIGCLRLAFLALFMMISQLVMRINDVLAFAEQCLRDFDF